MEYTIQHETAYYYPETVYESYTVVHLQPRSDPSQFCTKYDLQIAPTTKVQSYLDRFGNNVQHFAILPRHSSLAITTQSAVVTLAPAAPVAPLQATRALLEADEQLDRYYDFLHESAYVQFTPELAAFWSELHGPGESLGTWCMQVAQHIHDVFVYDGEATTVQTTVEGMLEARAGVCQDFAHLMIAVLRTAGIPARYVSGYIFGGDSRVLGAEASHAWCEAYLPPYGWVGFDPTNDRLIDDHFVKVALGRDYRDVSPVRGVYRGSKRSEMSVNVAMDVLQSSPQYQEQRQQQEGPAG